MKGRRRRYLTYLPNLTPALTLRNLDIADCRANGSLNTPQIMPARISRHLAIFFHVQPRSLDDSPPTTQPDYDVSEILYEQSCNLAPELHPVVVMDKKRGARLLHDTLYARTTDLPSEVT